MQVLNISRRLILLLVLASVLGSAALAVRAQDVPLESVVLVGAGDIAYCGRNEDEATAALIDQFPGATVYTTGDNAYEKGTTTEFNNCYTPSWGRHKARTYPSVGNHEYDTPGAAGYFSYFGDRAGPKPQGYYSYDLGAWHIVVLNSNCSESGVGGCGVGSEQERWLRADLARNLRSCILAYWHHPRFTSTNPGSDPKMQPFWQALYDYGAELVLNGHTHNYEHFAPQDPRGTATPNGIREFIVGTGGAPLHRFNSPIANSVKRTDTTFGVLKLTLHPTSYDWEFVPVAGQTFADAGTASCTPSNATPTIPTATTVAPTRTTAPTATTVVPTATTVPPTPTQPAPTPVPTTQRRMERVYLPLVRR